MFHLSHKTFLIYKDKYRMSILKKINYLSNSRTLKIKNASVK